MYSRFRCFSVVLSVMTCVIDVDGMFCSSPIQVTDPPKLRMTNSSEARGTSVDRRKTRSLNSVALRSSLYFAWIYRTCSSSWNLSSISNLWYSDGNRLLLIFCSALGSVLSEFSADVWVHSKINLFPQKAEIHKLHEDLIELEESRHDLIVYIHRHSGCDRIGLDPGNSATLNYSLIVDSFYWEE